MAIDWTSILNKHKGLWVALADDERTILASGKTAQDALRKAMRKQTGKAILLRVPSEMTPFVGTLTSARGA